MLSIFATKLMLMLIAQYDLPTGYLNTASQESVLHLVKSYSACLPENGKYIAVLSFDNFAKIYDARTGLLFSAVNFSSNNHENAKVAISIDGTWLALSYAEKIDIFILSNNSYSLQYSINTKRVIHAMTFLRKDLLVYAIDCFNSEGVVYARKPKDSLHYVCLIENGYILRYMPSYNNFTATTASDIESSCLVVSAGIKEKTATGTVFSNKENGVWVFSPMIKTLTLKTLVPSYHNTVIAINDEYFASAYVIGNVISPAKKNAEYHDNTIDRTIHIYSIKDGKLVTSYKFQREVYGIISIDNALVILYDNGECVYMNVTSGSTTKICAESRGRRLLLYNKLSAKIIVLGDKYEAYDIPIRR